MKTTNSQMKKINFKMNAKNTMYCLLIAMLSLLSVSCSGGDDDAPNTTTPGVGSADITVTAGGQQFKVVGPCGWAAAGGSNYIGANHATNSLRIFSSFFNITELPTVTTTYTLVDSETDTDPTHITMNVSEVINATATTPNTLIEWSSKDTSGTLTLVVNGNIITANLAGITLYPYNGVGIYANGNVGAFANNGALTGTLTFYRE